MTLKNLSLPFLLLFLFWLILLHRLFPLSPSTPKTASSSQILGEALEIDLRGRDAQESAALKVRVRARVGVKKITIQGYTSPYAQVTLSGQSLYQKTLAAPNGVFLFDQILFYH